MRPMTLDVLFRSCDRSTQVRYIDAPKSELLLRSLQSLVLSLTRAKRELPQLKARIHILDDHSETETIQRIVGILDRSRLAYEIVPMEDTGQSASMQFSCIYAKAECQDLIYFVEDDYLHAPSALVEMLEAYELFSRNLGRDVIISPCDHVVEYLGDPAPTRIVLGSKRHWRVARGTTSTYLLSRGMFDKHYALYAKHATYDQDTSVTEDTTINKIYREEFCFSPIPSLTAHVSHPNLAPLYAPWRSWWLESAAPSE
jgi:glycosyltransferase involved in cell wall biosynthesis